MFVSPDEIAFVRMVVAEHISKGFRIEIVLRGKVDVSEVESFQLWDRVVVFFKYADFEWRHSRIAPFQVLVA